MNKYPIILNPSPKRYDDVRNWLIVTNCNDGQNLTYTNIKAVCLSVLNFNIILADTVEIHFTEEIERIEQDGIKYQA